MAWPAASVVRSLPVALEPVLAAFTDTYQGLDSLTRMRASILSGSSDSFSVT